MGGAHTPDPGVRIPCARATIRATRLSKRDGAQLIAACIEAEQVPFAVLSGISANPRQFWDLSHAKELLGWVPKDSAPE